MRKITLLLAMAVLVAAVPAFAGHGGEKAGEKCTYDAQACLNHHAAMKGMGWTGVELDKSDATAIKVKAITPGSPAAKGGFQVGDIVVALNGASMADKEALKKAKGEWKAGQSVTYTIKRKNAEKQVTVSLAPIPDDVFASMLGAHLLANHVTTATAATEEAPAPATTTATEKTDK